MNAILSMYQMHVGWGPEQAPKGFLLALLNVKCQLHGMAWSATPASCWAATCNYFFQCAHIKLSDSI